MANSPSGLPSRTINRYHRGGVDLAADDRLVRGEAGRDVEVDDVVALLAEVQQQRTAEDEANEHDGEDDAAPSTTV